MISPIFRTAVGSSGACRIRLYWALSLSRSLLLSAPPKTIREAVRTFSFNMLSKKLERITSKPKDREIEEPTTMGVTLWTSSGPKFALSQMLKA